MADLNEQNDSSHTLTDSDPDNHLIFEDSATSPFTNITDLTHEQNNNYLLDIESGDINVKNITGDSNDGALGASSNDLTVGYYDETNFETRVWGTPNSDADYWRPQDGKKACAVVAQITVYESITGEYISEATAADFAQAQGWFNPETGTSLGYSDNILNYLGIETEQDYNGDINTIINALDNGDKVLVSLDGSEIWNPSYSITGKPYEQTNLGHTVWITGVQQYADNTVDLVINDSGKINPNNSGQRDTVNYDDFINAWDDYNNHITIVDA
jgi:hypothetical protein